MVKYSTKGVFLIMAVLLSLVVVQSPSAAEIITVDGTIESISYKPNMVVVDGTEVYGVRFNFLEKYNIFLDEGDSVSFEVYEYICASGEVRYKAISITVGDVTVNLREVPE